MTATQAASLAGILRKRPTVNSAAGRPVPGHLIPGHPVPGDDDSVAVIAWWSALKRGRAYPAPADLDRGAIGAAWPEAVLLSDGGSGGDIARATRLGGRGAFGNGAVEHSAMLTEFLLAVGRTAIARGAPVEEVRDFPSAGGRAAYRILALPLSAGGDAPDHVLCHLRRA
jgi:hypothetical protein